MAEREMTPSKTINAKIQIIVLNVALITSLENWIRLFDSSNLGIRIQTLLLSNF